MNFLNKMMTIAAISAATLAAAEVSGPGGMPLAPTRPAAQQKAKGGKFLGGLKAVYGAASDLGFVDTAVAAGHGVANNYTNRAVGTVNGKIARVGMVGAGQPMGQWPVDAYGRPMCKGGPGCPQ